MPMTGRKAHVARLKRIQGPAMERAVTNALFAGGQIIEQDAAFSITQGSVSGKGHVGSAPGEAPNNDTGVLARNIETVAKDVLLVEVSSDAPYSAALEFGHHYEDGRVIEERPFMRPARARKQADVERLVVKAVKHVVGGRTLS